MSAGNSIDLKRAKQIGTVTAGTEYYEDFCIDNVLDFANGTEYDSVEELHYHIYIPNDYDGSRPYALYITLPGYGAYYFQGVASNLRMERFAMEAKKYNDEMIIVAPQPNDWGEMSKMQTIGLTEYMLSAYNIDPEKVYISGYSGGGETLSLAVSERPELYTASLQVSSKWDGDLSRVAKGRTPVYLVIGEDDEYYGSEPAKKAYQELAALYEQAGMTREELDRLAVLDVKEKSYFSDRGVSNQHGGGGLFAEDEEIMGWLFGEHFAVGKEDDRRIYTLSSTVGDVVSDPYFEDFGYLLFPVERSVSEDMTLEEISSSSVYIWYHYIDPDKTVEIIQALHDQARAGEPVFFDIYSEEERAADPSKEDTGLFFFKGEPGEKFAVLNAGGGFMYVGAMQDSFPHALELSKMGYNSFALIYRPDDPYTDLAQAIGFIHDHARIFRRHQQWSCSIQATMLFQIRTPLPMCVLAPVTALQTGELCGPDYKGLRHWAFLRSFIPMKDFPMVLALVPGQ